MEVVNFFAVDCRCLPAERSMNLPVAPLFAADRRHLCIKCPPDAPAFSDFCAVLLITRA
jgi:hypothetical protein